jgi:hypothetical protein
VHVTNTIPGPIPIPPDQINSNLATIYESSLALITLLNSGTNQDLVTAKMLADAFVYALGNDNAGDPIPTAPAGSTGLHNGYSNGDLALFNGQSTGAQAGEVRLAGFSAPALCPQTAYCLVLDGATDGNNAFAILALAAAYKRLSDVRYLNAAETIGNWLSENLADNSGTRHPGNRTY